MTETRRLARVVKIASEKEQKFNIASGQSFDERAKVVRSVLSDRLVVK